MDDRLKNKKNNDNKKTNIKNKNEKIVKKEIN